MSPLPRLLFAAATVLSAGVAHTSAHAQAPQAKLSQAQAGYYRMQLGDIEITALSDGTVAIPAASLLTNTRTGEVEERLADAFQNTSVNTSINAYLVKSNGRLMLVDAGAGELFGPALNKLEASLKGAGVLPEQITDILVTHIHTDHTGGLMDGTRMVFQNATLHMDSRERDYWLSPANREHASASNKKYFDEALAKVKPYVDAGKMQVFDGTAQLFPGIRSIASPGHTPGHSFYEIQAKGGDKLIFWGDVVHVADVQMPDPAVTIAFDVDPAKAAATRKAAFADAVEGRYWVAGDHISFPGIGHLRQDGKGYRWVAIPYVNDYAKTAGAK
jgi:glyoxylase-like metal-dependent hydrolase (beta-lactamase superfamily II)